ncbi:uncharacterized protein BDR25DRAFT_336347 [Lindgomyces ingoldianus]|uniref:Uncharacterized protein n=1 Tax=Lindgomyces ingoldianus TaxID=673940 RepID=A0ACB6QJV6_9PLEO|nr:uncharacterized protein BDR25DRAFT_336347 [Lindgomyces ingoldianus]KAF2466795.1 hypothetical protein BDR25DRAFT_336347 [Lindgomyces ingoldianus]
MARLRKASPTDLPILPPASTQKNGTMSPRKTLRESPSKRELRYTSQDNEDSFLVPKAPVGDTPRKQRILRPVASNSRLLRKLSNESLASPEKHTRRRERGEGLTYLYSKSLARTMAKRPGNRPEKKIEVAMGLEAEAETVLDQSLWCGDDEDAVEQKKHKADAGEEDEDGYDDEEPVVDPRNRRRQLHAETIETKRGVEETVKDGDPEVESRSRSSSLKAKTVGLVTKTEMLPPLISMKLPFRKGHSLISNWAQEVIDLTSSPGAPPSCILPALSRSGSPSFSGSRPTSSFSNDGAAILQYSPIPKRLRSPRKAPPISRPNTPPAPPASPSKLVSPSKKKNRIPDATALRPSIDAFWSAEVVNDWNDQFSPAKPLISPRKQKWLKELFDQHDSDSSSNRDALFPSPIASPRKKSQNPIKRDASSASPTVASIRAQRKAFATTKHSLAESFLAELDATITNGKIAELSRPTGGIKIVWSKTLKTTAGRANWRREQFRVRMGSQPTDIRPEIRHHCSIELAEKVIDDEERLYNVLAHEYCHLTTFMISNQRKNPHGAEFKSWARRVSDKFKHLGVEVTTKHSYEIEYKYIWECVLCGCEYKRHSKSVDTQRHSCGKCKGKLVQTKPTPRSTAGGKKPGGKGEYQVFVTENFSRVKKELEERGLDAKMGKVMEAVAREYRERKGGEKRGGEKVVDEVELAFEALRLEDRVM